MIVFGVDCGCDRVSVAVMDSDSRKLIAVSTTSVAKPPTARETRVGRLHGAARTLLDGLADLNPPAIVLIEQPMGRTPNPVLMAGWGVITAAAVTVAERHGGIVQWENISTWRRLIGLADYLANQSSAKLTDRWKGAALAKAREVGYSGKDIDEADATCVAIAACCIADTARVTR